MATSAAMRAVADPVAIRQASDIEREYIERGAATMPNRTRKSSKGKADGAPEVADRDFYVDTGDGLVRYNSGDRLAPEHVGLPVRTVASVRPKGSDEPNTPPDGGRDLDEHPPSPEPHEVIATE